MTGSKSFTYRFNGRWNQAALAWATAQVEQFQACRGVAGGAAGQVQVAVVAARGVVKTFQRRSGAAQQQRDGVMLGACHGQIAGVVTQPLLLFERAVVLLVDNNHARLRQWGEDSRASPDNDGGAATGGGFPGVEALAIVEARVQRHYRHAKATAKTLQGLRCQANFRYQQQGLTAAGNDRFDQL